MANETATEGTAGTSAPTRPPKVTRTGGAYKKPQPKSYLLYPEYQTATLPEYIELRRDDALKLFARARWGAEWQSRQVCPKCGAEGAHYPVNQGAFKWKCRDKDCDLPAFFGPPFTWG